jgi:hypothetical protein
VCIPKCCTIAMRFFSRREKTHCLGIKILIQATFAQ